MTNKVIKLRFLLILTLGLLASVVGAQDAVDWSSELGDHSGETLRIIMIQDPWVGAFDEINVAFEELTGAEVIIDSFGYDATYEREVLNGTSASSEYDVVVLDSPWVGQFAESGFVDDLTPWIEADNDIVQFEDFMPSFQVVSDWKGEIVGIPFGAYIIMNHYRTDLFEQAGLDPIVTIEDFQAAAEFFTDNPDFPNVFGTAMNNQRGAAVGQAYFEYVWNFGGRPFESTYPGSEDPYADMTPLLNSPESIATVQFFVDMLANQPFGAESFAWDERATTFSVGQTAMVNAWSVRTPGFINPEQSSVGDVFATTTFPSLEGVEPAPPLGGWVMGINSAGEQKELAWDYIKWFTSPEIHKEFVLLGGPPSRLSTMQDADVVAAQPWATTLFESQANTYAEVRPRIPEAFQIIDIVGLNISRAIQGQATVEEAMNDANTEVADLLREAGYNVAD
jgi:multiple sugar transport system substrate-binding protein